MADESHNVEPLYSDRLTWAALLGRWVDFARQAVGLPEDEAGQRLRESVPDIIMLQAVWFALQHVDELPREEQALGLDRAEVLIDRHAEALGERWQGTTMPEQLAELMREARDQLAVAQQQVQGPEGPAGPDEPGQSPDEPSRE